MSKWCGDENCLQCADKEPDPYVHLPREDYNALRDERDRLARAIVWALGYTDFRAREQGEGAYWWRTELRLRAKLTGEQIDAILAAMTPAPDTSIIGKCEPPSQWDPNAQVRGDIS